MELVVDAHGHPALRLVDAPLVREQAKAIYADLRKQAIAMLTCGLIHGDLSPYNVLVGSHGPVVIDFPQVVDAAHNSQAETFFLRDLENVRRFCASLDPSLGGEGDGREIWRAYVRRELTADFVPTGLAPEPRRAERPAGGHHPQAPRGGPLRPQGGGHAPKAIRKPEDPAGPRRPEQRGQRGPRNAPAPEVIRVDRLPRGAPGTERQRHGGPRVDRGQPGTPAAGHPPDGAAPRADGAPGRRRRRRRRRGRA
jgi:RIO kinase 1